MKIWCRYYTYHQRPFEITKTIMCNCIIPNIHVATRHYLYSLAFEGSLCLEQLHNKGLQEVITSCTVIIKPQKDVFV